MCDSVGNRRKCSKCGKSRAEDMTVTYHRFPKPGKTSITKALIWAKYCWPNEDWSFESLLKLHHTGKVLCGRHFDSVQFYDNMRTKLSKFAVPESTNVNALFGDTENVFNQINIMPSGSCSPVPSHVDSKKSFTEKHGTLSATNMLKLSKLTRREVKLYNICRRELIKISKDIRRFKKNKKNRISNFYEDEAVQELFNLNVSNSLITLLQSQIRNGPKKPKRRRFTLNDKILSLVVYKRSPACYRLLRRLFALPSQSILNKLLNKVPLKPGINEHIFKSLQNMAKKQLDEDNVCVLSFHEMSITKHLSYDTRTDEIQGFEDHGSYGRSKEIATKALVFMVVGLRMHWKQPVAFYFSHLLTADRMIAILKEVLTKCFESNIDIVATVCEMSTLNLNVLRALGVTTRGPFFWHCNREIVATLHPPQLLKCTRDLFMKHDVECINIQCKDTEDANTGTAKWSHIESFYHLDKDNPMFVFAPLLKDYHIHPNAKQRKRLDLAAQVFSHHTTRGLLTKIAMRELPPEARTTALLTQKFDELFDALNANTKEKRGGMKYSTNLTARGEHFNLFEDMRKLISSMKFLGMNSAQPAPSQEGWLHTMNAIERLWQNVRLRRIRSLSTRRLNIDNLQNCLDCIRYSCGAKKKPTVQEFVAGFKTAIITDLRHTGQKPTGPDRTCENNTAVLTNNFTAFLTSDISSENLETDSNDIEMKVLLEEATEAVEWATPENPACGHVLGLIFKKLKSNDCENCRNTFLEENREAIHIFTRIKEYNAISPLNYMNKNLIECVETMTRIVNNYLEVNAWKAKIKSNIMDILECVDFSFLNKCQNHLELNLMYLKNITFCICIKRYMIFKNREMARKKNKS